MIGEPGFAEVRESGSRFFGSALVVETWDDVESHLSSEQKKHYDASHWCYASRWGIPDVIERSSDAGEPSGTAGLPILQEIRRMNLTNTLVIVTRYFGGTKLGTGGLVRMYGECARAALASATIRERRLLKRWEIKAAFDDIGIVYRVAGKHAAQVEMSAKETEMEFDCRVEAAHEAQFCAAIIEESAGRIRLQERDTCLS